MDSPKILYKVELNLRTKSLVVREFEIAKEAPKTYFLENSMEGTVRKDSCDQLMKGRWKDTTHIYTVDSSMIPKYKEYLIRNASDLLLAKLDEVYKTIAFLKEEDDKLCVGGGR